ncbi:MAG TPA: glycosyltransferase family 4 protein [Candidatus Binataceae bacterium]|nr:glycosyltransferase family 4 protein [Candidatus Binataceae bacterium]
MRIALATANARITGGAESYPDSIIPMLHEAGHQTALICEYDAPPHRRRINTVQTAPLWLVSETGLTSALEELKRWRPAVIFSQCMPSAELEMQLHKIAPTVNFIHTQYGLCISGAKMFSYPVPRICHRPLGKLCLAHFYPHRCGGLNPLTMLRDYRTQTARLGAMRSAHAIVTASEYMRLELLRHGFEPRNVHTVGLPVFDSTVTYPSKINDNSVNRRTPEAVNHGLSPIPHRVLFIGRLEKPKGASLLIDAMIAAAALLRRRLTLTFAGDGRERGALEDKVRHLSGEDLSVNFVFTGWLEREQLWALIDQSDLLAVPSLSPETFGLVGVEGGLRYLPAVAFNAGGIAEWLKDGVNGRMARSCPPTAETFASALADCLSNPANYARLRQGARNMALRFSPQAHLKKLLPILHEASSGEVWSLSHS